MLEKISKYRTELMGIATLWILLYHYVTIMNVDILHYISFEGYLGVDMFLFLSGFGLTIGYKKHSLKNFYKRRFLRIYIVYFAYLFAFFWIDHNYNLYAIIYLIKKLSGLGFFFENIGFPMPPWYIPTIAVLYLLFPLWMWWNRNININKTRQLHLNTLIIIIIGILLTSIIILGRKGPMLLLATARIPIFILGSMFGFYFLWQKAISHNMLKQIIVFSLFFYFITLLLIDFKDVPYLWRNGLLWFPFTFATLGILFIIAFVLEKIPSIFNIFFHYVGQLSLEIYIWSCFLLSYGFEGLTHECQQRPYFSFLLITFLSIVVSKIFQMSLLYIESIISKIFKRLTTYNR